MHCCSCRFFVVLAFSVAAVAALPVAPSVAADCKIFYTGQCPGDASCLCTLNEACSSSDPSLPCIRNASTSPPTNCGGACRKVAHGQCPGGTNCLADVGDCDPSQNTPEQAVAVARQYYDAQTDVSPYLCDHYVAFWYGHSASGWASAIDQWKGTRHSCSLHLPPTGFAKRSLTRAAGTPDDKKLSGWTLGALVFYEGGEYGHVAICAEDSGVIFSTDLPNLGKVGRVDVNAPVKDWGMTLLGYTVACVLSPLLSLMPPNFACLQIFPPCLSACSLAPVLKLLFALLWLKHGTVAAKSKARRGFRREMKIGCVHFPRVCQPQRRRKASSCRRANQMQAVTNKSQQWVAATATAAGTLNRLKLKI